MIVVPVNAYNKLLADVCYCLVSQYTDILQFTIHAGIVVYTTESLSYVKTYNHQIPTAVKKYSYSLLYYNILNVP